MSFSKILIVDDSNTDLQHLRTIVSDAGYIVVTATSGKEALEKAASEQPGLIFMDVIMNDVDGFKACRKLSDDKKTEAIPVVLVTSKHQKADKTWAKMQGAKGFITKPAQSDAILDTIKQFI